MLVVLSPFPINIQVFPYRNRLMSPYCFWSTFIWVGLKNFAPASTPGGGVGHCGALIDDGAGIGRLLTDGDGFGEHLSIDIPEGHPSAAIPDMALGSRLASAVAEDAGRLWCGRDGCGGIER